MGISGIACRMMSDEPPFFAANLPPTAARQPQPGELLFEFYRESDHYEPSGPARVAALRPARPDATSIRK